MFQEMLEWPVHIVCNCSAIYLIYTKNDRNDFGPLSSIMPLKKIDIESSNRQTVMEPDDQTSITLHPSTIFPKSGLGH